MSLFEDELRKAQQFRAQMNAREQAEQAALDYENKARAAQEAQSQQSQGGLGGVLAGIGNSIGNVGKGLAGIFGGGFANIGDIATSIATGRATNKNKEDFDKWLAGSDNLKDARLKNAGTALDAAATLSDLIPVVGQMGKVATAGKAAGKATLADKAVKLAQTPIFNMAQGGASEYAQEFIDNGENARLEDALKRAAVGTVASGTGTFVGNKLANRALTNPATSRLGKMLQSNVGRSAITGATAGAVGGGMASALEGGDIGQVLSSAAQGGYNGALGGATTAGVMGLAGTGIDKFNQKVAGAPTAQNIPEAPVRQRVIETETTPTRKGIAITDYDAGEQPITVRRANAQSNEYSLGKNAGSLIDGVLGPDNDIQLKNAKRPTDAELFSKQTGGKFDNAADFLREYPQELENIKNTYPEVYEAVRKGARDYSDLNALQFDGTGADSKSGLPELNRQQYYEDTIGKLHATDAFGGKTSTSYADVPDYMRNHLLNDTTGQLNGRTLQNDDILREFFRGQYGDRVDNMDLGELYDAYERLAQAANQNEIYTPENIANGIRMNGINDDVTGAFVNDLGLRQNIDVDQYPSLRKPLEVGIETPDNAETVYTKRTLPARNDLPAKAAPAQVAPISQETPQITHAERARLEREYTEARQRQGQTLLQQYGVLDAPTRRSVGDPAEVLSTLYDEYGLTNPAEVQYAANHVTGGDGAVSKITRKLASQAEKVDTRIQQGFLDDLMVNAGLSDEEAKTVTKQVVQSLRRAGNSGITDGNTALDIVKQLEGQIRQYKGENGTYHRMTDSESRKVNVLRNVKDEIQGRIWDAAGDPKKVIDTKTLNELKSMFEGNKKWENFVDNGIGKAQDGGELRHLMKPLVDGGKIVAGSRMSAGSFADSIVDNARTASGKGLANAAFIAAKDKITNSPKAIQARADKYARQAANANAQLTGGAPVENATGKTGAINTVKNVAGAIGDKIGNAASALNNTTITDRFPIVNDLATRQIARQAGKAAVNNTNIANEKANAQNALTEAQNAYNMAVGNYQNVVAQGQQLEQQMSQGAQQLQTLSDAMDRALAAGDIKAYGQLADLYQQAYKIYGADLEATQSNGLGSLTNSQLENINKLDTAGNAIDELEALFQKAGGGQGLIGGNATNFMASLGLNPDASTYNALSRGLINQIGAAIGKTDSLNTEGEVQRAMELIPAFTDDAQTASNKLAQLRQMLQTNKQTVYQNYGVKQQQ